MSKTASQPSGRDSVSRNSSSPPPQFMEICLVMELGHSVEGEMVVECTLRRVSTSTIVSTTDRCSGMCTGNPRSSVGAESRAAPKQGALWSCKKRAQVGRAWRSEECHDTTLSVTSFDRRSTRSKNKKLQTRKLESKGTSAGKKQQIARERSTHQSPFQPNVAHTFLHQLFQARDQTRG